MPEKPADSKIVLITGSSSGIGAGLAERLCMSGYTPIVTYRARKQSAESLAQHLSEKYGRHVQCHKLDVMDDANWQEIYNTIAHTYGKLDMLVCNAGVDYQHDSFEEIKIDEWYEIYNTKIFGVFKGVKAMLPLLKASKNPNIIAISASLATRPDPLDPVYSSACAALNNFAQSLVYSLGKYGIRTNTLCPGPMDTNLSYWTAVKKSNPDIFTSFKNTNPLRRDITMTELAQAVVAIAENSALNGNIIYANGGTHLR